MNPVWIMVAMMGSFIAGIIFSLIMHAAHADETHCQCRICHPLDRNRQTGKD